MLVELAVLAVLTGGGLALGLRLVRETRQGWARAAEQLSLRIVEERTLLGGGVMVGKRGAVEIEIAGQGRAQAKRTESDLELFLRKPGSPVLARLQIHRKIGPFGSGGVSVGDQELERRYLVQGDLDVALAALSPSARETWLELGERYDLRIAERTFRARAAAVEALPHVLSRAMELFADLEVDGENLDRQLLRNLQDEHEPRVASRLLDRLAARGATCLDEALAFALGSRSESPELCLQAACLSATPEARRAASSLAQDPALVDETRALAFRRWRALEPTAAGAASTLVSGAGPKLLAELIPALAAGGAMAQGPLIPWLQHRELEVQLAAVQALGELGDRDAIAPLLELAKPILCPGALRRAVQQATERIRARLGPAEQGRLSLVGAGTQGAVSHAVEEGALSAAPTAEPTPPEASPESVTAMPGDQDG